MVFGEGGIELGLATWDDGVLRAEAGVHLVRKRFELPLGLLAEPRAEHLAPQRREGDGRTRLQAQASREAKQPVGQGGRRVEAAPLLERPEADQAIARAAEAVVLDQGPDGLLELARGESCHGSARDAPIAPDCQRVPWRASRERMQTDVALVTGASSGIGEALARRLARDGHALALVARRVERLEQLAAALRADRGVEVHVLPADLTASGACTGLVAELERRGLSVSWLVNNAGFGTNGKFWELPVEREIEEIALNVEALVELTGRCLPAMVARGRGVVMNVASVGGFVPSPYMATYTATKAFVLTFSEAIAAELRGTGVEVLCVCPGLTRTEFQSHVAVDTEGIPELAWQSADEVADEAVSAVGRGPVVVTGRVNRLMVNTTKFIPRGLVTRVSGRVVRPRANA